MRRVLLFVTLALLCQGTQPLPVFATTFVLPNPAGEVTAAHVLDYIHTYLNIGFVLGASQVSIAT